MRAHVRFRFALLLAAPLTLGSTARAQSLVVPGPAPSAQPGNTAPPPGAPGPAPWTPPLPPPPPPSTTASPPPPAGTPAAAPTVDYVLAPVSADGVYQPPLPPPPAVGMANREATRAQTERMRFGPLVNIFSPNALFGVGVSGQVHRLFEIMVDVGYVQAGSTQQSAAATAEATVRLITPMARARLWPMERHNFIVDLGMGMSFTRLTADGRNRDGSESLRYERSGTPGIIAGGIGYGYRAPGPLRFAVVLGRQLMFGKLRDSSLTATDNFAAADRTDLKNELDNASKDIAALNVTYLQITIGLLF